MSKRKKLTPIQASAKGESCALRIPGVCNYDSSTTVFCHAPCRNRAGSRKKDYWGAYGCSSCHDYVDGRTDGLVGIHMTAPDWMGAIEETQFKLGQKGLLWLGGDYESKILPRRV